MERSCNCLIPSSIFFYTSSLRTSWVILFISFDYLGSFSISKSSPFLESWTEATVENLPLSDFLLNDFDLAFFSIELRWIYSLRLSLREEELSLTVLLQIFLFIFKEGWSSLRISDWRWCWDGGVSMISRFGYGLLIICFLRSLKFAMGRWKFWFPWDCMLIIYFSPNQ